MDQEIENKEFEQQMKTKSLNEIRSILIQQEQLAGIGQLVAGVAHEINNPLAYVMSNCSLLKDDLKSLSAPNLTGDVIDELQCIVDDIYTGLERVNMIAKGLSAISRIDVMNVYKEYNILEGIRDTINIAYNTYKNYADIEYKLKPVPCVDANPGQINQVLLNLILNAAYSLKKEHSESQKGFIRIGTDTDNNYIYCTIEDNGAGIPKEIEGEIFKPFFTTKPIGEGSGLGLSLSYDIIVNKHHGEIDVTSNPGEGAVFTFKIPIKQEEF